jgi:hypothetical protein
MNFFVFLYLYLVLDRQNLFTIDLAPLYDQIKKNASDDLVSFVLHVFLFFIFFLLPNGRTTIRAFIFAIF